MAEAAAALGVPPAGKAGGIEQSAAPAALLPGSSMPPLSTPATGSTPAAATARPGTGAGKGHQPLGRAAAEAAAAAASGERVGKPTAAHKRCGKCQTCLNPRWKKACLVLKRQVGLTLLLVLCFLTRRNACVPAGVAFALPAWSALLSLK
ncbi:hypothetical protein ABPG75_002194 [Micractinium tetrahymenae]